MNPVSTCDLNEHTDLVQVINFATISNFLEHFGHLVSELNINFDCRDRVYSESEMHEIFRLINLHCSDSLTTLTILTMVENQNTFHTFTKPFPNVRKLSLDGRLRGEINFNEIFPAVQDLSLLRSAIYNDGLTFLDQNIPNLQSLSITHPQVEMKPAIKNFLSANPHIRRLEFICFSPLLLSFIAEKLQHLEELMIYTDDKRFDSNEVVKFEHLKSFSFIGFTRFSSNMRFKVLEELHVNTVSENAEWFIDLAIEYKANLKNISLDIHLKNTDLKRLADADIKVEGLMVKHTKDGETEHIVRIIENNERLMKLVIKWSDYYISESRSAANELKNQYENNTNWFITDAYESFTFERRGYNL